MKSIEKSKLCPVLSAKIMAQSKEEVPIIIQFNNPNLSVKRDIGSLATKFKSNLPIINGFAGYMTTESIYSIVNNPEVKYISFDSKVYTLLDIASPTMEVSFPHDRGYKGEGITIAIIDTGVSAHSDLTKPNNRIIGFKDMINNKDIPYDDNGHGTHVAGIIAGNGFSSKGKYTGVAPKANILAIKALDKDGGGNISDIISAISYIVDTKDKYNTKIINLSLGTPANSTCAKDPLCKAAKIAVQSGLTVVTAAGNSGPSIGSILSPGISRDVITVGAVDDKRTIDPSDDTIAPFSSRGPTLEGLSKPDLLAPGVNINSLSHNKLNGYSALSGTSMATPLVSGAVALLLNMDKNLGPEEIKQKLLKSCINLHSSNEKEHPGMLNLKLLFNDGKEASTNNIPSKSSDSGGDLFDNIIMILIILFLLDARF